LDPTPTSEGIENPKTPAQKVAVALRQNDKSAGE